MEQGNLLGKHDNDGNQQNNKKNWTTIESANPSSMQRICFSLVVFSVLYRFLAVLYMCFCLDKKRVSESEKKN